MWGRQRGGDNGDTGGDNGDTGGDNGDTALCRQGRRECIISSPTQVKGQIGGTLNRTQTAITSKTFQQQWILDATGNWGTFKQDNDGTSSWDLVQARTANKVNEITTINNTTGAAWASPVYDLAGNMVGTRILRRRPPERPWRGCRSI